jgi:hypothetical protein
MTRKPVGPWQTTPGLQARLVELYTSPRHYTSREMAKMLTVEFDVPITRNAVIGKSHRINMPTRIRPVSAGPKVKKYSPRQRAPRPRVTTIAKPPQRVDGTVTIYQLRADDCRFPLGDFPFVFCGKEQVEGSSYCPEHFAICHGNVQRQQDVRP